MKKIKGIVDVRDDYDEGRPEIHIRIDREKAALSGINTYKIASTVRTAINGFEATTYRLDNEEYDIVVKLRESQRQSMSNIKQLLVPSFKKGEPLIPLGSIATVETRGGLNSIPHYDLDRLITVQADVSGGLAGPQAIKMVNAEVRKLDFPPGYRVEYGGESEMMEESFSFLGKALMVAVMLIIITLISQFNSFVYPAIIGTTLLMGVIGVAVGLGATGKPFGMMAFVGMISLFGIVVNNAIVLIDYILHLKRRGYPLHIAVVVAGATRFRPVMLTTITTILGLIPLTYGLTFSWLPPFVILAPNNNTAFWGPMGSVVIFGLVIATFFTLVVIPTLFYLVDRFRTQLSNSFRCLQGECPE